VYLCLWNLIWLKNNGIPIHLPKGPCLLIVV